MRSREKKENYSIPITEFKKLEPILTECFGYRREMFFTELQQAFYKYYPKGESEIPNKEQYMTAWPLGDEYAVSSISVLDYKRYAPRKEPNAKLFDEAAFMIETEHAISFSTELDIAKSLTSLLNECGEIGNEVLYNALLLVSIIYEKFQKEELRTEMIDSFDLDSDYNIQNYVTKVRPEMLKLYELLNTTHYSPKHKRRLRTLQPITIETGRGKIVLDNSSFWLTSLLDDYLKFYLGVNSLEEAEQELEEVYSASKGRKTKFPLNLLMYGTSELVSKHSSFTMKDQIISFTLDYLKLLGFYPDESKGKRAHNEERTRDKNVIMSNLANFKKQGYVPLWKPKQMEDYKTSPNNPSSIYLW